VRWAYIVKDSFKMVTFQQYINNHRRTKKFKSSTPKFHGCPYKRGTCVRVNTVKPKKPNSAQRKIAKVQLVNGRFLLAYIPGFGHKLSKNSQVLVRGGRVPDLPGVRYHIMRNKEDLKTPEVYVRRNRRSKYGIKKLRLEERVKKRSVNRKKREEKKKNKIDWPTRFKTKKGYLKFQVRKIKLFFITKNNVN